MPITSKRYQCSQCGHIATQETNHNGQTYSLGHFNCCPQCPPYKKYPEFGGRTIWNCLGEIAYSLEDMKNRADLACDGLGHLMRWHAPEHGESLSIQRATCKYCKAEVQVSTRGVTQGTALVRCSHD